MDTVDIQLNNLEHQVEEKILKQKIKANHLKQKYRKDNHEGKDKRLGGQILDGYHVTKEYKAKQKRWRRINNKTIGDSCAELRLLKESNRR